MIIYISDVRKAKLCIDGTKKFFKTHNLDFRDFVKNGIDEEIIAKIDDAMARLVLEVAHGRK